MSFELARLYMKKHNISYFPLANQGIDAQTLQRICRDKPITKKHLKNYTTMIEICCNDLLYTNPRIKTIV